MVEERIYIEIKPIHHCGECKNFNNCVMPCDKHKAWKESGYGLNCESYGSMQSSEQQAIDAWNKRS